MSSSAFLLAKSIMIATRYSTVRSQFQNQTENGQKVERKLIDYQTHQQRIGENIANLFVVSMTMAEQYKNYDKMISNIQKKNNFSLMAPMHTVLSGLKALFCNIGYEGIKTMKECCGAAGFSKYACFGNCIDTASSLVTLEGDEIVMNLQTARALLKNGQQVLVKGKKMSKDLAYINDLTILMEDGDALKASVPLNDADYFTNLDNLKALLKWDALYNIS